MANLKAEGVELFKQRRYDEAVKKFTQAIRLDESGNDEVKAQCHNNRAAAREHAGDPFRSALIADMNEAIRLKPDYGKAYAKRFRYHKESRHWKEALADMYAASHLGAIDATSLELESTACTDRIVEKRVAEWNNDVRIAGGERAVPVAHSQVHRLMSCFVRDDGLLKDVHAYMNGGLRGEGVYSGALKMFAEKQYDDIDTFIEERKRELGARASECGLLATLILGLKRRFKEARALAASTSRLVKALPEGERKRALTISSFVISYELAGSEDKVMQAWRAACEQFPSSPDVCVQAFACLSASPIAALTVINDPRVEKCDRIRQLREINLIFTAMLADPVRQARRCEDMLRAAGLPAYPTRHLAAAYGMLHRLDEARTLARHIAERDDVGELWFELSAYYEGDAKFEAERQDAVNRCLAADPMHHDANGIMAAGCVYAHGINSIAISKQVLRTSVEYAERCVRTFDMVDAKRLNSIIHVHEQLKALLRAAEMIGLQ